MAAEAAAVVGSVTEASEDMVATAAVEVLTSAVVERMGTVGAGLAEAAEAVAAAAVERAAGAGLCLIRRAAIGSLGSGWMELVDLA